MTACHALFSFASSMSACEVLGHAGATYSAFELHRASAVVLVVFVFVPHLS